MPATLEARGAWPTGTTLTAKLFAPKSDTPAKLTDTVTDAVAVSITAQTNRPVLRLVFGTDSPVVPGIYDLVIFSNGALPGFWIGRYEIKANNVTYDDLDYNPSATVSIADGGIKDDSFADGMFRNAASRLGGGKATLNLTTGVKTFYDAAGSAIVFTEQPDDTESGETTVIAETE